MDCRQRGFSLLELSIVIALIGLIAGIVLVSQGFVRRNELRTVLVNANGHAVALQQFRLKYGALPGDMPNATEVWGRIGGGTAQCASPETDISTGQPTCNGNGNGFIEQANCEYYRAWQQLAAAGFIQGKFTGVSGLGACAPKSVPGTNVPIGSVKNSGFSVGSFGEFSTPAGAASTVFFDGNYNNILIFGGLKTNDYNIAPLLKTEAARETDEKADDKNAATGTIRATRPTSVDTPNCATAAGAYNEIFRNEACVLIFTSDYLNKTGR